MKCSVASSNSVNAFLNEGIQQDGRAKHHDFQNQSKCKYWQDFLQFIDIYPSQIEIKVNNKAKESTFCGSILSLITVITLSMLVFIKGYSILVENAE